jgi:hypothetical protein
VNIAKQIILDEILEDSHPEAIEDVIFWALEFYADHKKEETNGGVIAYAIVEQIKEAEKTKKVTLLNEETINNLN